MTIKKRVSNHTLKSEPEALQKLWHTFKQVVEAEKVTDIQALDEEIRRMLSIKDVKLLKLTSTLFLINPRCFLPLDKNIYFERTNGFIPIPEDNDIKQGNSTYSQACQEIQKLFDGCLPYEINRFLYSIDGITIPKISHGLSALMVMAIKVGKKGIILIKMLVQTNMEKIPI